MVHSIIALGFFVPFQQREIHHPQELVLPCLTQTELAAHLKAEFTKLLLGFQTRSRHNQNQVALFRTALLGNGSEILLVVELIHRGLIVTALLALDVYEAGGTHLRAFHELSKGVCLLAAVMGTTLGNDTNDQFSFVKHFEITMLQNIVQFHKAHTETGVRLVATVVFHRVVPRDAFNRSDVHPLGFLEDVLDQAFKGLENVLLGDERHLAVNLGELGLTVGTEVFVAEALDNLEVAVEASHHQQLLEGLGRLRQRVELAVAEA